MVVTGHSVIGCRPGEISDVLSEHRAPGRLCGGKHPRVGGTGQPEVSDGQRVDASLVKRPGQRC